MSSRFSRLLAPLEDQADTDAASVPQAIIDIGSNSIRLVVWQDGGRVPPVMFNEKMMAGLGRGLAERGRLAGPAMAAGERTLARFAETARHLAPRPARPVATAAVRPAPHGPQLPERLRRPVRLRIPVLGAPAPPPPPAA